MNKPALAYILSISILAAPLFAQAEERADHFKGKPSESLEQALSNLQNYNAELARVLNTQPLTPITLHETHQLTYTLENALQKIAADINTMQISLEALHKASEINAPEEVKSLGKVYLEQSRPLVK